MTPQHPPAGTPATAHGPVKVHDLFTVPGHSQAVARLIHDEFWTTVPGASAEGMAERLRQADSADRIPLCLVALQAGQPVGVVNLVHSDDDDHPEWQPWLAGLVVAPACRGQGVGSLLVRSLLQRAQAMGLPRLYFGTDGPGFYTRLGAVVQAQPRADFWFMRFELTASDGAGGGS